MHYYKVEAEHVRKIDIGIVAEQMQKLQGVEVAASGRDLVFDSNAIWVLFSERRLGTQLQDIVWKFNDGSYCEVIELDFEEFENYC